MDFGTCYKQLLSHLGTYQELSSNKIKIYFGFTDVTKKSNNYTPNKFLSDLLRYINKRYNNSLQNDIINIYYYKNCNVVITFNGGIPRNILRCNLHAEKLEYIHYINFLNGLNEI